MHVDTGAGERIDHDVGLVESARGGQRSTGHHVDVLGGLGIGQARLLDQVLGAEPDAEGKQHVSPGRTLGRGGIVLPGSGGVSDQLLDRGDVRVAQPAVEELCRQTLLAGQQPRRELPHEA